ncbi:SDR family oxidoreductase [Spirosoma taeanense]|uniref:SDR family oxidoreductase n=1 Tax=Spirosoma taeanense TaxID=2735870 RepID=A0A6M5Y9K5_9BACT|nr:SDR family oxidoreductase [Spirosoma taeanense]QJW89492.1 SDR family oxidoreductase [Spirosoma taeanense]
MGTKNKIAIVTGGSRGMGRDMVLNLAKKGSNIIFTYHSNKTAAHSLIAEVKALGQSAIALKLDVSNLSTFDTYVEQVKQHLEQEGVTNFDYLVNNAGTGMFQFFATTTESQFDEMLNVHFKGVFFLTQKLLPIMNDGGRIVNISTGLTRSTVPGVSAYACMKGAVEVLTKYLAKELGGRKITINTVAPGPIATDFGGGGNKNPEVQKSFVSITALGRVGVPEDVGATVAYLCSDEAGWITGQRIEISGGMAL